MNSLAAKFDLSFSWDVVSSLWIQPSIELKGNSHLKLSVANMIELLLKSFLVYHSHMFEAWKVPKRPVEVPCDVTQHLVAYRTAVGTQTNSSGMRTHTGQHAAALHACTILA